MRFAVATVLPAAALAFASPSYAYDSSCANRAKKLKSAAEAYEDAQAEHERAKSDYESAKDSFQSACAPGYGYSRDNEGACAAYGYERNTLESAQRDLESAKSQLNYARLDLEQAIGGVSRSCGTDSATEVIRRACQSAMADLQEKLDSCESKLPEPKE